MTQLPLALIGALCIALVPVGRLHAAPTHHGNENTLLVWAGDQAHTHPDFVAVVGLDPRRQDYGKVIKTVPLPGPGAVGNEPHHVGLSRDGRTLALGGLLSVLRAQPDVFFFDVSSPRDPRFLGADDPPDAAITDEFADLSDGGFLVTFMGGANGAAPGRIVEYDQGLHRLAELPADPPADGFNPHGISIREDANLFVTSDFICPLLTLHVANGGSVHLRGSVRVWDLAQRTLVRTIPVGDPAAPAGTIDVKLIPHDPQQRAFTAGMADNTLYLVDTQAGTATAVFDFSSFAVPGVPVIWPQLMRINTQGTRLFITLNYAGQAGKVLYFSIKDPAHPELLAALDLGAGSGPHYLRLARHEHTLIVSDYFLKEDLAPGGVVAADGDHKVHVIKVHSQGLTLDPRFDLDLNRDIATGPARPHGLVALRAHEH
jgi:selenium-binding protein 1